MIMAIRAAYQRAAAPGARGSEMPQSGIFAATPHILFFIGNSWAEHAISVKTILTDMPNGDMI